MIKIKILCSNNKKTMQIYNNTLITECSAYDFKEMLERRKVKSWLNPCRVLPMQMVVS